MEFSSPEDVLASINKEYDSCFFKKDGESFPIVCLLCDSFCAMNYRNIRWEKLRRHQEKFRNERAPDSVRKYYTAHQRTATTHSSLWSWLDGMLLSPRCRSYTELMFSACKECASSFSPSAPSAPKKSICNGWFFGGAPEELTCLTEVELTFITPVRSYGYCFSYSGGTNKVLKGTLGYFKVSKESIVRGAAISSMVSEILNKNIIFVMYGEMTSQQKSKARQKATIRPDKVADAIRWLVANNRLWADVDLSSLDASVASLIPRIFDITRNPSDAETERTSTEQALQTESEESFSVYFPDSSMTELNGGASSHKEFERVVLAAKEAGYDATVVADLNRIFTNDYEGDAFVLACPLQFPYGIGGPSDVRWKASGEEWNVSLAEYAEHIAMLSSPTFHHSVFVLRLFNMKLRSNMLKRAFTTFNSRRTVHNLREDLTAESFSRVLHGHSSSTTNTASEFHRSLETINRSMPHTDSAAKRARFFMDSLQHSFGLGGIFLTVTPDDENSFLVSCYSMTDHKGEPICPSSLSNETLKRNAKLRRQTRIQLPGITGYTFDIIKDIVIKEVIGWDQEAGCAAKNGLFGKPVAFGGAIEEQGRQSLHIHFIVWIDGMQEIAESLHHSQTNEKHRARNSLTSIVENGISTELIGDTDKKKWRSKFDHECEKPKRKRRKLQVCSLQELRNMRHKEYSSQKELTLASCPDCGKKWTSEGLVLLTLLNERAVPSSLEQIPDKSGLLEQHCFEYTKPGYSSNPNKMIIHSKADLHRSSHVSSCFKATSSNKRSYRIAFPNECRMRLPQEPRLRTEVIPLTINGDGEADAFDWSGKKERRAYYEVHPQRGAFDAFVNTYVPAVSHSKIGGNSNARIITPGPLGFYTTKYPTKNTQEQNAEPYSEVIKALTMLYARERKHEDDRSESLRIIILSAFAHNKENLIGCSQASFLTRNNSRFIWSHDFAYVPHGDLKSLLTRSEISRCSIRSYQGTPYADVAALHYLCRPSELEDLSPKEFFEQYEVIRTARLREEEIMHFQDTEFYAHPSVKLGRDNSGIQFVRPRSSRYLFWLHTSTFEDTATFKGVDMMTCANSKITGEMESHAFNIMILLTSYRCHEDLKRNNSYVLKLRDLESEGAFGTREKRIMNNIQDCRANYLRVRRTLDPLQQQTEAFTSDETQDNTHTKEVVDLEGDDLNEFLDLVEEEFFKEENSNPIGRNQYTQSFIPDKINVEHHLSSTNLSTSDICPVNLSMPISTFISSQSDATNNQLTEPAIETNTTTTTRRIPSRTDIVSVLFDQRGIGGMRSLGFVASRVGITKANGSADSVIKWAKQSGLDPMQRRAFELLCSSFILSFYREADIHVDPTATASTSTRPHDYLKEKLLLCKLANKINISAGMTALNRASFKNKPNCIFIHGPGGSGKSAVINLLLEYAEEYCDYLEVPFNNFTIMVTAMSGVAATLVGGHTAHKALHFRSSIQQTDKELWENNRMVIVDEISFASQKDIQTMNKKLKALKDNQSPYGDSDMVFVGDMHQLEPVGNSAIRLYKEEFHEFHGSITAFVELNGMHRFKHDPAWGKILMDMRAGRLTIDQMNTINTRVHKRSAGSLPLDLAYATDLNADRNAINTSLFLKYAESEPNQTGTSIAIISSDICYRPGSSAFHAADDAWTSFFLNRCCEANVSALPFEGRVDPVLLLHYNKPVMVTKNIAVEAGIANGTKAYVRRVILKEGVQIRNVKIRHFNIAAVKAHEVAQIELQHSNPNMTPAFFKLEPITSTFDSKIPYPKSLQPGGKIVTQNIRIKATQLPIVCNNATTGHKLQGATVNNLYVYDLSTRCKNWIYVVLSRVREMKGLYLRKPLDEYTLNKINKKAAGPEMLLQYMRDEFQVECFTEDQYEEYLL